MAQAFTLAFLLTFAQLAGAQDSTTKASTARRVWPIPALRAGTPALVSLGFGVLSSRANGFVGPFVSIEPGIRAGRASAGYSMVTGDLAAGPIVRASFLRRYRGDVQRNYVGLEAQYVVALLGPRIGVFRSTSGRDSYLLAVDFGVGF